ncbi:MAG: hypothetical protein LBD52_03000 [Prevotellaceae bacterium]|nr:hypothetical protein [Prevotellaceae bacterium]
MLVYIDVDAMRQYLRIRKVLVRGYDGFFQTPGKRIKPLKHHKQLCNNQVNAVQQVAVRLVSNNAFLR